MYKNKGYNIKNIKLKKPLCLLIVLFLIATVFLPVVSSINIDKKGFDSTDENEPDVVINYEDDTENGKTSKDEKKLVKTGDKTSTKPNRFISFVKSILGFIKIRHASILTEGSLLTLYTNYEGNKKETPLKFGIPLSVDVDGDKDNDIRALCTLFPSIETPLALSLNFKLKITRLNGFEDKNAFFEAYAKFNFPGFLFKEMSDNYVGFGYQSQKDKEVPDKLEVTYKYIPYIFRLDKPVHKLDFNPGLLSDIKDISLLFLYDNPQNNSRVINKWIIEMSPAVKSTMTFKGEFLTVGRIFEYDSSSPTSAVIHYEKTIKSESNSDDTGFYAGLIIDKLSDFSFEWELTPFRLGGGRVEYQCTSGSPANVSLFFEKNNSAYVYVEEIPSHIKLSWRPELDGIIELNTFGETCKKVGIRNAIKPSEATAFAYVSNLPSLVQLKWDWDIFDGFEITFFVDATNTKGYIYSSDLFGTGMEIQGTFTSFENFDFTVFWDFDTKTFGILRSNSNLSIDLSVKQKTGLSFNFSSNIKNAITNPFEISFEEILQGNIDISFTGNTLEISSLDADIFLPGKGKFVVKMSKMIIDRQSTITFSYSASKNNGKTEITVDIEVSNGVEIYGLVVGYNEFLYPLRDIVVSGYYTHSFSLTFEEGTIDWWMSKDLSQGHIIISGGILLTIDSEYRNEAGEKIGEIVGNIAFDNEDDELKISWSGKEFVIDGSGVLSISGFHLWIKNKIDVNIPALVGRFRLNTTKGSGALRLLVDDNSEMSFAFNADFSIKSPDFLDIVVEGDFTVDFGISMSGCVDILFQSGSVKIKTIKGSVGYDGFFKADNLYVKVPGLELSCYRLSVSGDLSFDVFIYQGSVLSYIEFHALSASIIIWDFDSPGMGLSLDSLRMQASGSIRYDATSDYININMGGSFRLRSCMASFGIDGLSHIDVASSFSVSSLFIYGITSGNIKISKGGGAISLSDFYLNVNRGEVIASWDLLYIDGQGSVKLNPIEVDATIRNIEFTNFYIKTNTGQLKIEGSVNLLYAGEMKLLVSLGTSKYIKIILDQGTVSADFTDFDIRYIKDTSKINLSLESLQISGVVTLLVIPDSDGKYNVGFNGKGAVVVNNLNIEGAIPTEDEDDYLPGDFSIDFEYFNLELDDIKGSVLGLEFGDTFNVYSASVSGSISSIDLQGLSVFADEVNTDLFYLRNANLSMEFVGSGNISLSLSEPDQNGVQNLNMNGEVNGDGSIYIKNLMIYISVIYLEIEEFLINGPTTFHLNAEGIFDYNIDVKEKLKYLKVDAGCDSTWSIGRLFINSLIEIFDFNSEGPGDISFSGEIPSNLGDPNGTLVISIAGIWSWSEFKLLSKVSDWDTWEIQPGIPIGAGYFDGDVSLALGFGILSIIFPDQDLPNSSGVEITANEESDIILFDFLGITNVNLKPGFLKFIYTKSNETTSIGGFPIPENLLFEIENTMEITLSAFELDLNFLEDTDYKLYLGGAELKPGSLTFESYIKDAGNVHLKIQSSSTLTPTIDIFKLTNIETSENIISAFDIVLTGSYLEVEWNIDAATGDPDLEGYVYVDTGNQLFGIDLYMLDKFHICSLGITADEFNISWDFNKWWQNPLRTIGWDGSISLGEGGISLKLSGVWYVLWGNDAPSDLNIDFEPSNPPYYEDDQFYIHVSDSGGNDLSGASVKYEKKISAINWQTVKTLTTGSDGDTGLFDAEYTDVSGDNGRITVSHPDYDSATITFRVNKVGENEPPYLNNPAITGPSEGEKNEQLTYTAHATDPDGDPIEYRWKSTLFPFGTGWFTEDYWSVIFSTKGTKYVQVQVRDNHGHVTDWSSKFYITITEENNEPNAIITSPHDGYVGQRWEEITFDGSNSYDTDGSIVSYEWDFGDGNTDSGAITTHTYLDQYYPAFVTLTVTDNDGDTDTCTHQITISNPPGYAPTVDAGGPYYENAIVPIEFDGSGSQDYGGGYIVSYEWDFGDGNTGSGEIIEYLYSSSGTYTVTLTIIDNDGWVVTDTTTAEVDGTGGPPSQASKPSCSGSTFNVGEEVDFSTSATDPDYDGLLYQFDWGNGERTAFTGPFGGYDSGEVITMSYTWSTPGTYDVTVRAKDVPYGNIGYWSESKTITII